MSKRHPIIVVTGSSGAGTTTVKHVFDGIFRREGVTAATIEGDAFHRFDRAAMKAELDEHLAVETLPNRRNGSNRQNHEEPCRGVCTQDASRPQRHL